MSGKQKGDAAVRKDPERPSRVPPGGELVGGPEETTDGYDGEGGGATDHPGPGVSHVGTTPRARSSAVPPELPSLRYSAGHVFNVSYRQVSPAFLYFTDTKVWWLSPRI